jgi:hypothetical protein
VTPSLSNQSHSSAVSEVELSLAQIGVVEQLEQVTSLSFQECETLLKRHNWNYAAALQEYLGKGANFRL